MDYFDFEPVNKSLEFPRDLHSIVYTILGWGVLHCILQLCIYSPLGVLIYPVPNNSPTRSSPKKITPMEEMYIQRRKVHSAAWKFTFFSILSIVGCYILLTENWALDPPSFFRNWPDVPMSSLMRFYYNLELAGYLYTLLLMPFEPKQTALDIIALLIHHGSTIFLLWNSYIFSLHRIGIIIATLHDVSDPFMELAKLILYSGRNKLADAFFGMFAAIFIITRNFIFPLYAINSTFIYMKREDGTYFPTETFYFTLLSALWVLEVLHVYWSYLILKMVRKALSEKGVSDDIRNTEVVDHEKEE